MKTKRGFGTADVPASRAGKRVVMRKAKGMSVQLVPLSDVRPNPFRHITQYPLSETKVAELMESIQDTGFWTNVCARPLNGHFEIAYGHHRIEAAKRIGLDEVPLVIEEGMNDERVFAMMKRENSESYGISAAADAGVVAGLIAGYVEGRLTLKPIHPETPTRTIYLAKRTSGKLEIIGPGGKEVEDARSQHNAATFTTHTLSEHLSWTDDSSNKASGKQPNRRFYAAFKALTHLILPGTVSPTELEGLNQKTVMTVADAAKGQPDPKAAAQAAISEAKSEQADKEKQKRVKRAAKKAAPKKKREPPTIEKYATKFIEKCKTMKNPYTSVLNEASRMLPYIGDLDDAVANNVAGAIERMIEGNAKRGMQLAEAFRNKNSKRIKALLN